MDALLKLPRGMWWAVAVVTGLATTVKVLLILAFGNEPDQGLLTFGFGFIVSVIILAAQKKPPHP